VDAGVGAAGDGQPHRLAEDAGERVLELALDRAPSRLGRPAPKPGAVVGEVEPVGVPASDDLLRLRGT